MSNSNVPSPPSPSLQGHDSEHRQARLRNLEALRELGVTLYPSSFERSHLALDIQTHFESLQNGESAGQTVAVAGRVMASRNSGMFMDVHDASGKIQVFGHAQNLGEKAAPLLAAIDLGDIIGVHGVVRRTPRGELTVDAHTILVLSKALLPLPEKYHGLTDQETRYRKRYLDFIMNETSRQVIQKRSQIISQMRHFLDAKGFLEVETPMLHAIAGGAAARPFATHHNTLDTELFLRIAPELFLKRLIVGGVSEKLYEINRCFRNEGLSPRHNPEFTTLELYQAYADYREMQALTEELVAHLVHSVHGQYDVCFGDVTLNFAPPWRAASMTELVEAETGVDFLKCQDAQEAHKAAAMLGFVLPAKMTWGKIVEHVFAEKVEPTLVQPTHVLDLPRDISPLAKAHPQDARLTERFETYVNTWEIANAFSELADPIDQKDRFLAQMEDRAAGDGEAHQMDVDFLTALEHAMPPTGGLGVGIDRLVMLLTNSATIREVIAFPTLRPLKKL